MDIKNKLNEKQYLAASSDSQYLRIIAGAGTGKTRTLSYRIAYLIDKGMQANRITAITFTNKAAKEMLTRVEGILENESDHPFVGKPLISTFHGFCYRFLKKEISHIAPFNNSFTLIDESDQNAIYKQIFKEMTKGQSKEFVQKVIRKISDLKSDGKFINDVTPRDIPLGEIYSFDDILHVYKNYQYEMLRQNCVDFDDLLMFTSKIMADNPDVKRAWQAKFDIFLVDEFQDTNLIQYNLVKEFMRPACTLSSDDRGTCLTVVGDPDQTIYTWRGAKNDLIKNRLQRDFPRLETVVLDDNYRSTQNILDCANRLIQNNKDRMDKNLNAASNEKGYPVSYTNYASNDMEGNDIAHKIHQMVSNGEYQYNEIAIIYRANYLSNALEKQLTSYKIPYQVYGGLKFFERAEIKDALSYLRILINADDFSFQRVLNAPSKGIGEVTLARAKEIEKKLGGDTNLLEVFRNHSADIKMTSNSRMALSRFFRAYDNMVSAYRSSPDNDHLLTSIRLYYQEVGFMDYILNEDKKANEKLSYTAATSNSKIDNVNEFIHSLTQALDSPMVDEEGNPQDSTLEDFLISVALQSDQDTMKDLTQVSLMTGHVSKGLEFPVVFVTGVNQMIFPSSHALKAEGRASIEEERRLFYVAMTRAQKELYVSSFGGRNFRTNDLYFPSQFIKEAGLSSGRKFEATDHKYDYYASLGMNRPSSKPRTALSSSYSDIKKFASGTKSTKFVPNSGKAQVNPYKVGDRVIHITFGKGTVLACEGDTVTILFADPYGQKKMKAGFKAFRKLEEEE